MWLDVLLALVKLADDEDAVSLVLGYDAAFAWITDAIILVAGIVLGSKVASHNLAKNA